jgi:hypothetical protein
METLNTFGPETIPASTPVSAESTGIASILPSSATATPLRHSYQLITVG